MFLEDVPSGIRVLIFYEAGKQKICSQFNSPIWWESGIECISTVNSTASEAGKAAFSVEIPFADLFYEHRPVATFGLAFG